MLEELQLDRRLQLALDALSFDSTTEVQSQVIPAALAGGDLVVSAETGSGKTLAYLVPTVQRLLASDAPREYGPAALVLVPTRELARQVLKHCRALLAKTPLQVYGITGGADFRYQESLFRKNPEIIVATPGRLLEHCERKSTSLAELQVLVLDEADRMLDMGFRDDVLKIIGYSPDSRQVIMVSATLNHRELGAISRSLLKTPQTIAVGTAREPHSTIDHQVMLADGQEHKDKLLFALLEQGGYGRVLVFGNKRSTAIRLAGLLKYHKLRCACLHGEMSTEDRRQVITRFNDGKLSILCASDVAARGIDIKDIDLVINYDLPHSGDDYLHRTGRTGRAGASGLALSLVTATDWNLMISIERYLKLDFQRRSLPGLKARFNGPKKQKASGKAAGSKKKVPKPAAAKSKSRKRNQKNVGKPSARVKRDPAEKNDGFAPLMKKKTQALMRTFFGLEAEATTAIQIADWRDRQFACDGRPVPPANFHITLAFVGETSPQALENLCLSVDAWLARQDTRGAKLLLDCTGYWPKPGIYWLGPKTWPDTLSELAAKLRQLATNIGARRDRNPFQPHVTLFRQCVTAPLAPATEPAITLAYRHFTLFESRQGKSGVSYHPLQHWELAAPAG